MIKKIFRYQLRFYTLGSKQSEFFSRHWDLDKKHEVKLNAAMECSV